MRIWKYAVSDKDPKTDRISNITWDGGKVLADTFDEAVAKVKKSIEDDTELSLEITLIEYDEEIKIE